MFSPTHHNAWLGFRMNDPELAARLRFSILDGLEALGVLLKSTKRVLSRSHDRRSLQLLREHVAQRLATWQEVSCDDSRLREQLGRLAQRMADL
jgi:hypothetical protein